MSGHSKWSTIKHKKGAADAKRSKIWTKIIREITVAVKMGGEDVDSNPRLRKALDEAKSANMPKDTINRAVQKGSGVGDTAEYEDLTYEGYGPAGVAILADCLTDNRNRTSTDIRTAFNKNGGNLGTSGSVSFGFKKRGEFAFTDKSITEDGLMEVALDAGLDDIVVEPEGIIASCDPEYFHSVIKSFEAANIRPESSELAMVPDNTVKLADNDASKLEKLVEALEDLDDVQNVWTNAA